MNTNGSIYIAGHTGLLGSAFIEVLRAAGYGRLITISHNELDLCRQVHVERFFSEAKPEYVIIAAAKVGGIGENMEKPGEFIYTNSMISANIINSAHRNGIKKLIYFGSGCMYPKKSRQPMKEEYLLAGRPEPTSQPYAVSKLMGLEMCLAYNRQYSTDYKVIIPANIYGPNDHFNKPGGHVIPALIKRFDEAKSKGDSEIVIWGSGKPRREFVYALDVAEASLNLLMQDGYPGPFNVGSGVETSIKDLAESIRDIVGYKGRIIFDKTKPDGAMRKLLDSSKVREMGWEPKVSLEDGIKRTYEWYKNKWDNIVREE